MFILSSLAFNFISSAPCKNNFLNLFQNRYLIFSKKDFKDDDNLKLLNESEESPVDEPLAYYEQVF